MLEAFVNAFKVPDLRKKLVFTLFIIGLYRLGSHIPVPGINRRALENLVNSQGQGLLVLFDTFSGGAFRKFTIECTTLRPSRRRWTKTAPGNICSIVSRTSVFAGV